MCVCVCACVCVCVSVCVDVCVACMYGPADVYGDFFPQQEISCCGEFLVCVTSFLFRGRLR